MLLAQLIRCCVVWSLVTAGVLCCPLEQRSACAVDRLTAEGEALACGPRAVFLLLRDFGVPVTYAEVRESTQLSERGASVAQLERSLRSFGVTCSIRRLDPSDLLSVHRPMVAYLSHLYRGNSAGHFVYIPSVSCEGPEVVDPVVGNVTSPWRWRSFSDAWSGVCLVADPPPIFSNDPVLLVGLLGLALLAVPSCASAILVRVKTLIPKVSLVWALCAGCRGGLVLGDDTMRRETFRCEAHGGVNAAGFLHSCLTEDSPALHDEINEHLAATVPVDEVRRMLTRCGCETTLRRLTMEDLSRALPAIVLLRYGADRAGSYCLVLAVRDGEVDILRAGPMTADMMPVDEFRRRWTGHALIPSGSRMPRHSRRGFLPIASIGILGGIAVARIRSIWSLARSVAIRLGVRIGHRS